MEIIWRFSEKSPAVYPMDTAHVSAGFQPLRLSMQVDMQVFARSSGMRMKTSGECSVHGGPVALVIDARLT